MSARDHQVAKDTQFRVEAFRASVLVVLHGGAINDREIEALLEIGHRILPEPIDRDDLGQLCSSAVQNRVSAANYVRSVCRAWSIEQKQRALGAMFVAATADAGLDAKTLVLLASLRDAMNLTDEEYESAIEAAIQWDDAAET